MSVPSPSADPAVAPRHAGRDPSATRQRFLDAGTALFARRGLHDVTSAQIAREAGFATGTFYLHFKDKQALFREIVFGALAELRARQDRAGERAAGDLASGDLAVFRARAEELLAFAEDNRDLIRVVFGRGGESATLGEEILDEIVPGIESVLRWRKDRGEAPASLHETAAAQAIAGMMVRLVAWWIDHPDDATRDDVVETLIRMHPIHGVSARNA